MAIDPRVQRPYLWWGLLVSLGLTACVLGAVLSGRACQTERQVRLYAADEPGSGREVPAQRPLRVLVSSMVSPQSTFDRYAGLVAWLGQRVQRPAVLLQRRGYSDANQALQNGEADMAFVCTGAYLSADHSGRPQDVLVVPVVQGRTTYQAVLVVQKGRGARRLEDLRGGTMAYVDPLSLTGRQWASQRLRQIGDSDDRFFGRILYTGSHDRSVEAVAAGLADIASVDNLVLGGLLEQRPEFTAKLQVLEMSPPFGIPPVVVPAGLDPTVRADLVTALTHLHRQRDGQEILRGLGFERFVLPPADHFDSARAVWTP